eukprot:4858571-Karenia_brevis.AAC.1
MSGLLHVVVYICEGKGATAAQLLWDKFSDVWLTWAGPPKLIYVDQEKGFGGLLQKTVPSSVSMSNPFWVRHTTKQAALKINKRSGSTWQAKQSINFN